MSYRLWSVDTVTGVKQAVLQAAGFDWSRLLNAGGSGTSQFMMGDFGGYSKADFKDLTQAHRRSLVLEWVTDDAEPAVIYQGIINGHDPNRESGILTISHADIWWMWARRFAVDHTAPAVELTSQTYTSLSLRTILKRQVQLAITASPIFNYGLPITFPPDEVGPYTRTLYGYYFDLVSDALDDGISELDGPDIDFMGRWVADKLDILMRGGTNAVPYLAANSWEWGVSAPESPVVSYQSKSDANRMTTNSIAIGEGSEVSMLARSFPALNPPNPATERKSSYKQVSDSGQLQQLALGDNAAYAGPTVQRSLVIPAASPEVGLPSVADIRMGDNARLWFEDDPWEDDGLQLNRITGMSGTLGPNITLELHPGGV